MEETMVVLLDHDPAVMKDALASRTHGLCLMDVGALNGAGWIVVTGRGHRTEADDGHTTVAAAVENLFTDTHFVECEIVVMVMVDG
jgi:hypothetical protein